jgi:hypothetical protein
MIECLSDLAGNGIHTHGVGRRGLCDLAVENLDYFQAMLGYDAGPREVVRLMEEVCQVRDCRTRRVRFATTTSGAALDRAASAAS